MPQWLGLTTFSVWGWFQSLVEELRFHSCIEWWGEKKEEKNQGNTVCNIENWLKIIYSCM